MLDNPPIVRLLAIDRTVSTKASNAVRGVRAIEPVEPWAMRNSGAIVLIGGGLTVVLGLVAVFLLPALDSVVGNFSGGDLQRARADIRTSGLALATGVGAATAGLLAWGRLELSRRQHHIDRERYLFDEDLQLRQHELAEQSQRNERFAKSVELLGHSDGSVRLGALYALEGLARDNFDRQTVYDVISAYARSHVPTPHTFEVRDSVDVDATKSINEEIDDGEFLALPAEDRRTDDYEAAITICLRVPLAWALRLDLRDTLLVDRTIPNVARINLAGASFTDCQFDAATVTDCSFLRATLTRCRFLNAQVVDCRFAGASLSSCLFDEVSFVGTSLDSATLGDCVFDRTTYDLTTSWPHGKAPDGATESASSE